MLIPAISQTILPMQAKVPEAAAHRAAPVATSDKLTKEIRRRLGELGGDHASGRGYTWGAEGKRLLIPGAFRQEPAHVCPCASSPVEERLAPHVRGARQERPCRGSHRLGVWQLLGTEPRAVERVPRALDPG